LPCRGKRQRDAAVLFRDEVSSRKGLRHSSIKSRHGGQGYLGQKVYAALKDVPAPVDMVDIFRTADVAPEIVREALAEKDRLGIKTIWMQLGVVTKKPRNSHPMRAQCRHGPLPEDRMGPHVREIGWLGVSRNVIDNRKPFLFGKGGSLKR